MEAWSLLGLPWWCLLCTEYRVHKSSQLEVPIIDHFLCVDCTK